MLFFPFSQFPFSDFRSAFICQILVLKHACKLRTVQEEQWCKKYKIEKQIFEDVVGHQWSFYLIFGNMVKEQTMSVYLHYLCVT